MVRCTIDEEESEVREFAPDAVLATASPVRSLIGPSFGHLSPYTKMVRAEEASGDPIGCCRCKREGAIGHVWVDDKERFLGRLD